MFRRNCEAGGAAERTISVRFFALFWLSGSRAVSRKAALLHRVQYQTTRAARAAASPGRLRLTHKYSIYKLTRSPSLPRCTAPPCRCPARAAALAAGRCSQDETGEPAVPPTAQPGRCGGRSPCHSQRRRVGSASRLQTSDQNADAAIAAAGAFVASDTVRMQARSSLMR